MTTTIVGILVDETASMSPTKAKTISGVNEYLSGLQEIRGNVRVTLSTFNSILAASARCAAVAPEDAPRLSAENYRPRGMTPLFDAMGSLILDIERQAEKYVDPKILVFVVTDGEENASEEWTRASLLALIRTKTESGWAFAYLGADHDAFGQGGSIGVSQLNTMTYEKGQEDVMWNTVQGATRSYVLGETGPENLFSKTGGSQ
jgi:hypothetical protein